MAEGYIHTLTRGRGKEKVPQPGKKLGEVSAGREKTRGGVAGPSEKEERYQPEGKILR